MSNLADFMAALPRFKRAWASLSDVPFNPDMAVIERVFSLGLLQFHIEPCGWYAFSVTVNPFTSVPRAECFSIFVEPEERNTSAAQRLMVRLYREAKKQGAKEVLFTVPMSLGQVEDWAAALGEPIDIVFRRSL